MMRKINLLGPCFFVLVLAASCSAQPAKAWDSETGPIRLVAEMYTSGEPAKLRMAFHPEAKLFAVRDGKLWTLTFDEYLANVVKGAASTAQRPQRTVDRIERAGNTATATITTVSPGIKVIDFLTLLEISGQWKIISKAFFVEKTSAAGAAPASGAESQSVDREIQKEKKYFDFLLGTWVLEKSERPSGTTHGGDDLYEFRKVLNGNAISAEWYFNRGTKDKPDYANAMYFSAFDISTKTWSFYYISEKSAQYWEGRKENGRWVFYKEFTLDGAPLLQKQEWQIQDQSTILRRIDNSKDGGKTWTSYFFTLKKKV
jgi:hypothetical protein